MRGREIDLDLDLVLGRADVTRDEAVLALISSLSNLDKLTLTAKDWLVNGAEKAEGKHLN